MHLDPNLVINRLGGTSEAARICEVSAPAVSEWRKHGIPKSRLQFLRLARPDVFTDENLSVIVKQTTTCLFESSLETT